MHAKHNLECLRPTCSQTSVVITDETEVPKFCPMCGGSLEEEEPATPVEVPE